MTEFLADSHPFIVHFAIALTMMSVLFDLVGAVAKPAHFETTGLSLAIAAVPFLLCAVLTGNAAETLGAFAYSSEMLEQHTLFANLTVWFFSAIVFARVYLTVRKQFSGTVKYAYLAVAIAAAVFAFYTGMHGGRLSDTGRTATLRTESIRNFS
ncbi:MAG: hypothetical protein CL946_05995 [Ectothiorhodospiraceae bacterium]|nr:hypothetical protein [Ectothiorhodospiraceae bacterium]